MRNKLMMLIGMGYTAVIWGTAIFVIYMLIINLYKNHKKKSIPNRIMEWAYIVYIMLVLNITGITTIQELKFEWFTNSIKNIEVTIPENFSSLMMIAFNIIMFIPFGLLTPWMWEKMNIKKTAVIAIIFTIAIELIQGFSGRFVELNDVLANTLGAIIGIILYLIVRKIKKC